MIESSVTNKIRYALDAKQFLMKMLDLSFATMSKLQKYSDKGKNEEIKIKVPTTIKEWINFELSK